ncbi:hypothetical protein GCM10008986_24670 [Salinibacillus aidingensis]|uniref:Tyr recombinase domain-containing protein n=1 Tax=Salinibacillus aidingensis TaxID=237684 RepID=A0ABN1BFM6_9BACI
MTIRKIRIGEHTNYKVINDLGRGANGTRILKQWTFNTLEEARAFEESGIIGKGDTPKKYDSIERNSIASKGADQYQPYKLNTWNNSEVEQFIKLAEKEDKDVLYDTVLNTGLRKAEVLALSWSDIDFTKGTLAVNKYISPQQKGRKYTPLIARNRRIVQLPDHIIQKLSVHKERQKKLRAELGEIYINEFNLVFTSATGGVLNPRLLDSQFKKLIGMAGLKEISFHDLRHTHASLLILNGTNLAIVKDKLGHPSIESVLNFYSHLWTDID